MVALAAGAVKPRPHPPVLRELPIPCRSTVRQDPAPAAPRSVALQACFLNNRLMIPDGGRVSSRAAGAGFRARNCGRSSGNSRITGSSHGAGAHVPAAVVAGVALSSTYGRAQCSKTIQSGQIGQFAGGVHQGTSLVQPAGFQLDRTLEARGMRCAYSYFNRFRMKGTPWIVRQCFGGSLTGLGMTIVLSDGAGLNLERHHADERSECGHRHGRAGGR
jgi:hypothetical protein